MWSCLSRIGCFRWGLWEIESRCMKSRWGGCWWMMSFSWDWWEGTHRIFGCIWVIRRRDSSWTEIRPLVHLANPAGLLWANFPWDRRFPKRFPRLRSWSWFGFELISCRHLWRRGWWGRWSWKRLLKKWHTLNMVGRIWWPSCLCSFRMILCRRFLPRKMCTGLMTSCRIQKAEGWLELCLTCCWGFDLR